MSEPTSSSLNSQTPDSDRKHPVDAVHFVHHAIKHAIRDTAAQQSGKVSGEGLCRILLELAVDEFGGEGANVLKQWNIQTSDDVGLIVVRMQAAEVDEAQRVDQNSNFGGWFDLDQPADQWNLKW
ncbi:hypothetical protein EC9_36890 [Rosistilla ulvae]|uniref:Uncharacterized protein n=1 Tax=Rosistilla ulvae TaxID=1930277 RepID=A0A517M3Q5_9BACT|nr:hypothetical protein [Rosistilla ulvae]QDS89489.1 hypothetical protein EC9_36890 [Rosistilla ulvae]